MRDWNDSIISDENFDLLLRSYPAAVDGKQEPPIRGARREPEEELLSFARPKKKKPVVAQMKSNWAYVAWFLFYFILFSVMTLGIAIPFFIITVILAFTPIAEKLWRKVSGIRPLRLKSEKERLYPLFGEVLFKLIGTKVKISPKIMLYTKEDISINAFAFGKSTVVLTRGSIELLNDDCLKGLIAHEFGHFANKDTEAVLLSTVSNFFMSFTINKLTDLKNRYDEENKKSGLVTGFFKAIFDLVYYIFKAINFIGELILMHTSRRNEYLADMFAHRIGFGKELAEVLNEIYSVSVSKPQSVKEQLKSTHPDITLRIERLEEALDK
ncbi:MAG: M48 family metalloprotease [Dehalococcoidia bacterium]|nr:M48 family metalloprotease [Dehalococcoidia bacterium]